MPMSNIQQLDRQIKQKMKYFNKLLHMPKILRTVNIHKTKGTPINTLFEWMIGAIFSRYSIERNQPDAAFTRKTVRNCLNNAHINWQKLVVLIASNLVNCIQYFAESHRSQALIIDDSLFKREFSTKTGLCQVFLDLV